MFVLISLLFAAFAAPMAAPTPLVLNNGPCLDSLLSVPQGLYGSDPTSAVIRIDKVVSTATMTQGEIIGYLYTRQDGTTWISQRRQQYMSAADSDQANQILASTHMPKATVTEFPPVRRFGVKTNYQQIFQVQIPQNALEPLHIDVQPCVAWPAGAPLPNPLP